MADPTSHAGTLGPPQDYLVRDYAPVDTIRREYLQQLSDKSHFVGCDVLGYVMAGNRAIANHACGNLEKLNCNLTELLPISHKRVAAFANDDVAL